MAYTDVSTSSISFDVNLSEAIIDAISSTLFMRISILAYGADDKPNAALYPVVVNFVIYSWSTVYTKLSYSIILGILNLIFPRSMPNLLTLLSFLPIFSTLRLLADAFIFAKIFVIRVLTFLKSFSIDSFILSKIVGFEDSLPSSTK